jgi:hypothetical protein
MVIEPFLDIRYALALILGQKASYPDEFYVSSVLQSNCSASTMNCFLSFQVYNAESSYHPTLYNQWIWKRIVKPGISQSFLHPIFCSSDTALFPGSLSFPSFINGVFLAILTVWLYVLYVALLLLLLLLFH